jgi:predicted N-acetyltransferase YhbS
MSTLPIVVRPFETAAERNAYYLVASRAFNIELPEGEYENAAARRRQRAESLPGYDPNNLRGAFRGSTFLGGYRIQERWLQVGTARLLTCCIGSVATHPDYRMQGVASALMQDAIAYAQSRGHALLLLDGIAHFYHRFGYTDVFDLTDHTINRALVLAQPPSSVRVRLATLDDAPALLELYQRHYGPYTGSFARTLAQQQYLQDAWLTLGFSMLLALGPDGQPCGYLLVYGEPDQSYALEAAADSWPAALALLQSQAHLLDALPEPEAELYWRLPPDAPTFYLLADHLDVQDTSAWESAARGWSVRSQTYQHPDAGWMARVASLPALAQAMLPEWQGRWRRSAARWTSALTLVIDSEASTEVCALEVDSDGIRLLSEPPAHAQPVILSQQVLTRLVFGYRPISWAASQPNQSIPAELLPVLDTLFPPGHACIAGSDDF